MEVPHANPRYNLHGDDQQEQHRSAHVVRDRRRCGSGYFLVLLHERIERKRLLGCSARRFCLVRRREDPDKMVLKIPRLRACDFEDRDQLTFQSVSGVLAHPADL